MASSFLLNCRRGLAGCSNYWISGKLSVGSSRPFPSGGFYPKGANQMSTASEAVISTPRIQNYSPSLMLPPDFEGDRMMNFKFYSLAENKVLTLMPKLPLDLELRGSSHGWLSLFNPHNFDLFLYNPISHRQIKLPPIQNLPNHPYNEWSSICLTKVILSCSPDDDEENCRAVMIYNCIAALAFCCPGSSEEWTPFGTMNYDDCAYSTGRKVLFSLTNLGELETWDLSDPSSPRKINMHNVDDDKYYDFSEGTDVEPTDFCTSFEYLVAVDQGVLVVSRYVMEHVGPDGSYVDALDEGSECCPHMTVDFHIFKYDPKEDDLTPVDSLGGLALFLGPKTHSIALSSTEFPELKPNSIYFTDPYESGWPLDDDAPFGGHDIGIFDYEDRTVSRCYYPCDVQSLKKIVPSPMWFFPTRPI